MIPHKVHGTHVPIYIKYTSCAFKKRENKTNMETNNFKTFECFGLVKNQETEKVQIVFGKFLISPKTFNDFESARKYIRQKPWELIINVTNLIIKYNQYENKKQEDKGDKEDMQSDN